MSIIIKTLIAIPIVFILGAVTWALIMAVIGQNNKGGRNELLLYCRANERA